MKVRPYLNTPHQPVVNTIDTCNSLQELTVGVIVECACITQKTVTRQVLHALEEGGMGFTVSPTRKWQTAQDNDEPATPLTSINLELDLEESSERVIKR
jgi:hypothetical protein